MSHPEVFAYCVTNKKYIIDVECFKVIRFRWIPIEQYNY
jgi:hypothetical protein